MLNKGNFTRDEWNHLLCLLNISHFSSTDCSEVMSKRTQKNSGEERVKAKSRPMSLIARALSTLSSSASESPVKSSYESQSPWSAKAEEYDWTEKLFVGRDTRHASGHHHKRLCFELSTLLRMGRWKSLAFSRVESWWIDGWQNGDTRCLLSGKDTRVSITFFPWIQARHFWRKKSR